MSKNSARQTCDACQEWIQWGKGTYKSLRKKKKPVTPEWMKGFGNDEE